MDKILMVDLKQQLVGIEAEIRSGFDKVFESTGFINGSAVRSFSSNLATYLNAKHVIPCGNGTDALQIALMALDLSPGDEVITTPFTFVATAEVIALLKLKPVFVDIYDDTFNIDVSKIEKAITSKTKVILPVHLFGQCCDMEPLLQLASTYRLSVVEDNAQSIGADFTYENGDVKKAGLIGDIGCTSFYPTKNLGGYGDGGALYTNDDQLAKRISLMANHGSDRKYYYDEVGVNSRLDSFQAVVLDAKLRNLDRYNLSRQAAAAAYTRRLDKLNNVITPHQSNFSTHVFHQYTIVVEERDALQKHLNDNDIPCMVYYPVPLHISAAYAQFGYKSGDFPIAEAMSERVLSLPMHSELSEAQVTFICDKIEAFYKK